MEEVRAIVPDSEMPTDLGGAARVSPKEFVKQRLRNFPGWNFVQVCVCVCVGMCVCVYVYVCVCVCIFICRFMTV